MDIERLNQRMMDRKGGEKILVKDRIPPEIKKIQKVFIVGAPRSGTTLVNAILAGDFFLPECTYISTMMKVFDGIYKYSDDERFNYYANNFANLIEVFKKPIFDFLDIATTNVNGYLENKLIFKDPVLTLYLEYFQYFFEPNYKVILCIRDPRDVVASLFEVYKRRTSNHEIMSEYSNKTSLQKLFHDRLINSKQHYGKLFDQAISELSRYFYKTTMVFLNDGGHDYDLHKIFFLKYEDFVVGEKNVIRDLEDFIGAKLDLTTTSPTSTSRLDHTSEFFTEYYGKGISSSPIGRHKSTLSARQINQVENQFSNFLRTFGY